VSTAGRTAKRLAEKNCNDDDDDDNHSYYHVNRQTHTPAPPQVRTENFTPLSRETTGTTTAMAFTGFAREGWHGISSYHGTSPGDFHSPLNNVGPEGSSTSLLAENTATILLGRCINENIITVQG
ncbi:unnamed protein product, partial [Laminaria digitata]